MANGEPRRVLSLFDTTNLIVGIIVGAGVFVTAPAVADATGSTAGVVMLWALGGVLSLCGALGYAELATAYPEQGGDYVYLTKAYGRWAGFLFGWIQTVVVRPGDIAVMAFVFAAYAGGIGPLHGLSRPALAAGAVVVLTVVNIAGVRGGARVQNVLTVSKLVGVAAVIVVSLTGPGLPPVASPVEGAGTPLTLALILVLFSYGGWNETALVAAEVRQPARNIVRAMVLGMAVVTAIYLALNLAFVRTLGVRGTAESAAVAADAVATVVPRFAGSLVSALICLCALGAVNGLVFTGGRISFAVGRDHRVFAALGRWSARTGTPVRALLVQAGLALALIVALGSFVDTVLYTAAPVYLFYLATSLSVIVLRLRDPDRPRPYRTAAYPLTTIVFAGVCVMLIVAAVQYRPWVAAASAILILLGVLAYLVGASRRGAPSPPVVGAYRRGGLLLSSSGEHTTEP